MKKALVVKEETNMYGGAHCTNYEVAKKALEEGREIVVHHSHYDGQQYHCYKYRVTNLRYDLRYAGDKIKIIGDYIDKDRSEQIGVWTATQELCEYAKTGRI